MGQLVDLHKEWAKNKDLAKFAFSEGTKKKGKIDLDLMAESMVPAYPLKFKADLGPSLDKLEKAKPGSKDVAKYLKTAKDACVAYRKEITDNKNTLDKFDARSATLLLGTLTKIENALKNIL